MIDQLFNHLVEIAREMVSLRRRVDSSPEYFQGLLMSIQTPAGLPRTATVDLGTEGIMPGVGMGVHHGTPADGVTVWVVRIGPNRYLMHHVQG